MLVKKIRGKKKRSKIQIRGFDKSQNTRDFYATRDRDLRMANPLISSKPRFLV